MDCPKTRKPSAVRRDRLPRLLYAPSHGTTAASRESPMTNAIALLKDLVRCASVTPETAGVLDVLERALSPLGFTVTRMRFEGRGSYPVDNLFATRGSGSPHLLF